MANTNGAFGLRPIGVQGSGANTTGTTEYRIASGNTNAIYQGSPVIPLSTGFIDIVGAAAGGTVGLLGVFWGCEYVSSTTGEKVFSNYWPGSGADSNHPLKPSSMTTQLQTYVITSECFTNKRSNCSWSRIRKRELRSWYFWFNNNRYFICNFGC